MNLLLYRSRKCCWAHARQHQSLHDTYNIQEKVTTARMCDQSVTGQSFRGKGPFVFTVCTFWLSVAWQQLGLTPGQHCIKSGAPCLCRWNTTLIQLTCVFLLLEKGPFAQLRLSKWPSLAGPLSYYHTKDTAFPECPAVQSNCSWLSYNLSIFSISSFYRLF